MNVRQVIVRAILGAVLAIGFMGEMTPCAGENAEAKKPTREDIEKVGEKLKAAVEAGEMTEEEGWAKWEAYLESVGADKSKWPTRAGIAEVAAKLKAAVEAGEITAEAGRAKMQAYLKSIGAPDAREARRGGGLEREWRKLHEELAAQGLGQETWGELFKKKGRGEALEPKEEEAIRRIMELKKKADPVRTARTSAPRPGDKVLDRFRGTWFADVVIRPSAWMPEGRQQSEVKEVKWILNGRFQESTTRGDNHEAREIQRVGGKTYYKWTFGTGRFGHGYWTGTWDEEAKTMTWKLDFGAIKGTMVDSFADPDPNYVTTLILEDVEGKVLLDSQTEHTRLLAK